MGWFSKRRNIAIAVGAGVLLVVCSVLVTYGVLTHEEPDLLMVCWTEGPMPEARYQDHSMVDGEVPHGSCDRPEKLVWPKSQIPLTVSATSGYDTVLAVGTSRREALDAAVRHINERLGFMVFRPVSDVSGTSVMVQVETAMGVARRSDGKRDSRRTPLGYARHYWDGPDGKLRCRAVVFSNVGGLRLEYLVSYHELLHCLGLGHDPSPSSAMYAFTDDDVVAGVMRHFRVSDHDRRVLRRLYREKE